MSNCIKIKGGVVPFYAIYKLEIGTTGAGVGYFGNNEFVLMSKQECDTYMDWLNSQRHGQNDDELEIVNQRISVLELGKNQIPKTKWLIGCWEYMFDKKLVELENDEIKGFLHDCLRILDYAGAFNNKNRSACLIGDNRQENPTDSHITLSSGKTISTNTENQQKIEKCNQCRLQNFFTEYPPCSICVNFSNFEPLDDIVAKTKIPTEQK